MFAKKVRATSKQKQNKVTKTFSHMRVWKSECNHYDAMVVNFITSAIKVMNNSRLIFCLCNKTNHSILTQVICIRLRAGLQAPIITFAGTYYHI